MVASTAQEMAQLSSQQLLNEAEKCLKEASAFDIHFRAFKIILTILQYETVTKQKDMQIEKVHSHNFVAILHHTVRTAQQRTRGSCRSNCQSQKRP